MVINIAKTNDSQHFDLNMHSHYGSNKAIATKKKLKTKIQRHNITTDIAQTSENKIHVVLKWNELDI